MAKQKRQTIKSLRYFVVSGELHKTLKVVRPTDALYAWNYPQHKVVMLSWGATRRYHEKVWTTAQVAKMVERHPSQLTRYISEYKGIPKPHVRYSLDGKNVFKGYMWNEKQILQLHDYMLTLTRGPDRKDGIVVPPDMPSRAELLALLRYDTVTYIKTEDGEFVPVYKERI